MPATDPEPSAPAPSCSLPVAGLIGFIAAVLFILLSTIRLEGQGPQYDELHQATGAFTHLGSPPQMFAMVTAGGYPVMNMPYSAAIKTNLYGLYLRLSGSGFRLVSWRLFGILSISIGIVLFCCLARWALPAGALAVFLALLLSDGNVLVLGRYDWGPVALALVARLTILGLWLRGQVTEIPSLRNSFALGVVGGLAILEKLSSCLLVLALAAMLLASRRRRNLDHFLIAAAGGMVGILPLVLVNLYTLDRQGLLISLRDMGHGVERSLGGFLDYSYQYLALGAGKSAAGLILGLSPGPQTARTEVALLVVSLVSALAVVISERNSGPARWAGVSVLAYLAVWIGLYLFPRPTWIHHWILGTPFQYVTVALALAASRSRDRTPFRKALGVGLAGVAILWVGARLPVLAALERAYVEGRASRAWDPSLSQIGLFAAERADQAIFVASDWGVGTQIYCFSNGHPGLVHELFWGYLGPDHLHRVQTESGTRTLYLVRLDPPPRVVPAATDSIERDLAADQSWREVPVEPEVAHLRAVKVRKFLYLGR